MFSHNQEANKIENMTVLDLLILQKESSLRYHLLSRRDSRPSSLCKPSQKVLFITPVIISAAESFNWSADSANSLIFEVFSGDKK